MVFQKRGLNTMAPAATRCCQQGEFELLDDVSSIDNRKDAI